MISSIGWYFGGPYAAVGSFFLGAGLICFGILKYEGDRSSHPSILTERGSPYPRGSRLKSWHKYGLIVSILCFVVLSCFGIYRHRVRQTTTDAPTGPIQPPTPLESLTVSPLKLIFKDQAIGKVSSPQVVTVINRASAPRFISEMKITGDFSQTNDCPSELMVGDSCNIEVTFTPITLGLTHGGLEVSSGDPLFSSINLFAKVDFSGSGVTTQEQTKGAAPVASTSPPQAPLHQQPGQPDPKQPKIVDKLTVDKDDVGGSAPPVIVNNSASQPSPVRIETSAEILEEIRGVLEKDRESEEMQGCPAGTSVELHMVGNDISFYRCTKQCFAAWKKVNPKNLDFGDVKVIQPFDDHKLAVVAIPCLHPDTVEGFCLTEEVGTFPSKECVKKKLKTDYYQSFGMTVHTDNVDSLLKLWKEFSAQYK